MRISIDIDPTQQDWREEGHYDYDQAYALLAKAVLAKWPSARITRERYTHEAQAVLRLIQPENDDDMATLLAAIEADARFYDLDWVGA